MARYLMGVDEAGRGPLAGPVAVGVVLVPVRFDVRKHFPGVNDSKKLSQMKRETLFALLKEQAKVVKTGRTSGPAVRYVVVMASAKLIDQKGISYAIRRCVDKGVRKLTPKDAAGEPDVSSVRVLLDGSLKAPPEYAQQTIIRGDASEPVISLASIAAKVTRDQLMKRLAKKYPGYGFEVHKGYGTRAHLEAIHRLGLSTIHRTTYTHTP